MKKYFISLTLLANFFIIPSHAQNMEVLNNLPDTVQQDILQQVNRAQPSEDPTPSFQETVIPVDHANLNNSLILDQLAQEKMQIFGADFFSQKQLSSLGSSKLVSQNYEVGPGDVFEIKINASSPISQTKFIVNQNGSIFIDSIGTINVTGLKLSEASEFITKKARRSRVVKDISISILETKNVEVFIYGESKNPDKYLIRSNSSILDLISFSGGISEIGSYRNIQHIRDNKILRTFDLYNYLISAMSFENYNFMEGDLLFIKPYEKRIQISGGIKRPAIYELKADENLDDLLNFALGTSADANLSLLSVERLVQGGFLQILNPFVNNQDTAFNLYEDDKVHVPVYKNKTQQFIAFEGAFSSEINISKEMLSSAKFTKDILFDNNSYPFFLVKKNSTFSDNRMMHVKDDDLGNLSNGDTLFALNKGDVEFLNSSYLYEFITGLFSIDDLEKIRSPYNQFIDKDDMESLDFNSRRQLNQFNQKNCTSLEALTTGTNQDSLERLSGIFSNYNLEKSQSSKPIFCPEIFDDSPDLLNFALQSSVLVVGHSMMNGIFPINPGTNLSQFVNFLGGVDIYSYVTDIKIQNLQGDITIINNNNFSKQILNPGDIVSFGQREYLAKNKPIRMSGQLVREGLIPYRQSMTLLDAINASGGYKKDAFTHGGVLIRQSAKESERKAIDKSYQDLVSAIAGAISSGFIQTDISAVVPLLQEIVNVEPTGRIITEFNELKINNDRSLNMLLEPGDEIFIPRFKNAITIAGEVLAPITLPYEGGLDVSDYINLAGGLTSQAAKNKIYLVHPNGRAYPVSRGIFSSNSKNVLPGSVIFVPRNPMQYGTLRIAETIAPIISSLAISAASLNSISSN